MPEISVRSKARRTGGLEAFVGALALVMTCGAARSQQPPNIVFILVDDWGWRDAGFQGSRYYDTPRMDRMALEGMVFSNGYSSSPNCAPTRGALMSGTYAPRTGMYTVGDPARGESKARRLIPTRNVETLAPSEVTLAEVLKAGGYATAHIGKWHLGGSAETGPMGQGFAVNIAGSHLGHPISYFSPYGMPGLADGPVGEYLTDRLTDEAIRYLERKHEKPFFLHLAHYGVHGPFQAKASLIRKYAARPADRGQDNAVYGAMVESVDQGVGRILDRLDQLGLSENTLVILTSDNGGMEKATSNAPLRGSKGMLYEGGIRVPLVFRWKGRIRPGTRSETPTLSIDYFPTLLELAGIVPPNGKVLDGISLVSALEGGQAVSRKALHWHFPCYLQPYVDEGTPFRTTPAGAIRIGDFKLIEYFEYGQLELYDLKADSGEARNLARSMPSKVAELRQAMHAWRDSIKAPVPTQLNPEYDISYKPKDYVTWEDIRPTGASRTGLPSLAKAPDDVRIENDSRGIAFRYRNSRYGIQGGKLWGRSQWDKSQNEK